MRYQRIAHRDRVKIVAPVLLVLSALCRSNMAAAADKLSMGPPPDWVVLQEAAGVPDTAASADVGFMLEDRQLRLSAQVTEIYFDSVGRVQSPQGLNAFGNIRLTWNPDTMSVTVHKLQIRRPNQTIDVLATQSFTVLRREQNLELAVIDGLLTATVQLAGLQVGDVIELSYTIRYADPILAGSAQWLLGGWVEAPIGHLHARAVWDPSLPIRWKASDSVSSIEEKRSGTDAEVALDLHDAQPRVQPKGAPLRFLQLREIELTSFQSWADISRRIAPLYAQASRVSASSPLNTEIATIKSAHPDPVTRAEAALALVQDQVRYVFLGMNEGGLVPADASETWTRRFGDCKAKTALLLALLHSLGIESEPVVVSTVRGDGVDQKLPMLLWFNHVFVRAQIAGRTYWLDGSRSGDRRLANLPDPAYRWGLPLVASGSELVAIPIKPLDRPATEQAVQIDASAGLDVPAPFHVELTMRGDAALQVNRGLLNVTATEQDRRMREFWKKQFDSVDITSVKSTFDESEAQEIWTMDGKAQMDWSGNSYETDGLGLGYNADFERLAGPMRDAPIAVPFPSYSRLTETVLLPNSGTGFTVEGADFNRTVGGVEYRRHATLHLNQFSAEATSRALTYEFSYTEATDAQVALRELNNQTLRIRAPTDRAAAQTGSFSAPTPMSGYDYDLRAWNSCLQNNCANASSDVEQALKLNPKDDRALVVRAFAEIRQDDFASARKDIDAARALNGRNAEALAVLGMLQERTGHPRVAVDTLSQAIKIQPGDHVLLSWRAQMYASLHENDLALADSAAALRTQSSDALMHVLRAELLLSGNKPDPAVAEADTAVALATASKAIPAKNKNILLRAAYVYQDANGSVKAMSIANRLLESSPSSDAYVLRESLRSRTDLAGRKADIEQALKLDPNSIYAYRSLVELLFAAGEYDEEVGALSSMLALPNSDRVEVLSLRAVAYAKSGRPELGHKDLKMAMQSARSAENFNDICWNLGIGETTLVSALISCDKAIALAPDDGAYADSRALVLLRLGRYREAATQYDRALALKPAQAASLYGRGIARRRSGDLEAGDRDISAARLRDADVADRFAEYGIRP